SLSPDGHRVLVFSNSKTVWRQNTRGDYWVLDLASGALRKLGGDAPASSLMFAKFSPDNGKVGYVRANNIYVEDLASGKSTQLTYDGSDTTDRKSTRLNSSHVSISYAVFCLKKK